MVAVLVVAGLLAGSCSSPSVGLPPSSSGPTVTTGAPPPASLDDERTAARLCSAWTDYAVTVNAVAGVPDDRAAHVEVVSAAFLDDAVAAIGASWPSALVAERSAVLTDLVGPYSRRAKKAVAALAAVGASDADLGELRLVWREVVADLVAGAAFPERLTVPATMSGLVDAAVAEFAAAVTPFAADPTLGDRRRLLDPLQTPLTEAYLERWCPGVVALDRGVEF